ncbi:hypothetical protein Tco_0693356, partial [Tanacetum coccineum]
MNGTYVDDLESLKNQGDTDREVNVPASVSLNKPMMKITVQKIIDGRDDQAIQDIFSGLPEDIICALIVVTMIRKFWLLCATNVNGFGIGIHERRLSCLMNGKVQNPGVQNLRNQNGVIVILGIANQNGNGNVVAARVEGNANRNNDNQIRCYNCRGLGLLARNCTVRPRRRDAAYLQTQLLIAQKEEAGIQLQAEEFDLMAAAKDLDEIEEVNANCILMGNLQQASTSGTQTDKAPVYDSDGSVEVHDYENCYNNEIFDMFTQEEQTRGGTVEQHPLTVEETYAYFESLYNNLAIKVEKVNTINRKLRETNADLTTELASSILNEEFSDDTTPSVEQKFLNEALEWEIERLLRAIFSQDIMSIMHSNSVVDTLNFQIELDRTKERFENRIIKKENEYAKLWNDWYNKCEECKYDKISYDKAYNNMQQKIKRLQARLGDLKGKCKDTPSVLDTFEPLSQKLENENVELEFQIRNYAKENAHLKTAYQNMFDSINVTRTQTK